MISGSIIYYALLFRHRERRAKREKNEKSVHYAAQGRKDTAAPPVFKAPSPQPVPEGGDRWSSEDSVVSSDVGVIRTKEDAPPSLNTIRSDDNIESLSAAGNIQNDVRESIYDVPPIHHPDTTKLRE
jgi:hypothetical protein